MPCTSRCDGNPSPQISVITILVSEPTIVLFDWALTCVPPVEAAVLVHVPPAVMMALRAHERHGDPQRGDHGRVPHARGRARAPLVAATIRVDGVPLKSDRESYLQNEAERFCLLKEDRC